MSISLVTKLIALPVLFILVIVTLPQSFLVQSPLLPTLLLIPLACSVLFSLIAANQFKLHLWAWILQFVFIFGYFTKTVRFGWLIDDREKIELLYPEFVWVTDADLVRSFDHFIPAYVLVTLTSIILILFDQRGRMRFDPTPTAMDSSRALHVLAWVSLVLIVGTTAIKLYFGFGSMGTAAAELPFRLDTVVTRISADLAPALLLLCIWLADSTRNRRLMLLASVFFLVHMLLYMYVSTSRGTLVRYMISVILLWYFIDRFTSRRKIWALISAIVALISYPIISSLRHVRMAAVGYDDIFQLVGQSISDYDFGSIVTATTEALSFRISGVDGLWYLARSGQPPRMSDGLFSIMFGNAVPTFYTYDVVGVAADFDFRAPGLVGALWLISSPSIALILLTFYVFTIWLSWRLLRDGVAAPVTLSIWAWTIFNFSGEGTLQAQGVIASLLTCLICEFIARKLASHRKPFVLQRRRLLSEAATSW